jgi:hypothetical protein
MVQSGDKGLQRAGLGVLVDRYELTEDLVPLVVSRITEASDEAERLEAIAQAGQLAAHPHVLRVLLERCRSGSGPEAYLVGMVLAVPRGAEHERRLQELADHGDHSQVRTAARSALRVIREAGNSAEQEQR